MCKASSKRVLSYLLTLFRRHRLKVYYEICIKQSARFIFTYIAVSCFWSAHNIVSAQASC